MRLPAWPSVLMPKSLLARTFLLTAGLAILTAATLLLMFRLLATEPRARDTAELSASAVNLIRAALIASAPERRPELFSNLRASEGIRLLPAEANDRIEPLPEERYYRLLQENLRLRLGDRTRTALAVNDEPGFWISFRLDPGDEDEYWVILPAQRARYVMAWQWLAWAILALIFALLVAWRIASRLTRPLARFADAAREVGAGRRPEPIQENGAEELQQLAAAFNSMAAELEQNDRDRAEVLAGISHDLRTPLTRLRLEAEMSPADAQTRQAIVADIEQMESVIAQFLDYARGDNGEAAMAVAADELLQGIAAQQQHVGRELATHFAATPTMQLYPKAFCRAVVNLLDNAYKYGGGGVFLACRMEAGCLVVEIGDEGPGIPATACEEVKRPFKRLDTARSGATGTGLGLAIVERVARLHGGCLRLMAREPRGLIARLQIPFTPGSE